MFLYFNFRKNGGFTSYSAFHKQEVLADFILKEIKTLIRQDKDCFGNKNCPDSKALEAHIDTLKAPSISQLKDLINKYEEWTTPCSGPALFHEIKELFSLKDNQI